MKPSLLLVVVPIALGLGFLLGRKNSAPAASAEVQPEASARTRAVRPTRADPFGGPSFSLHSLDDVRALFKKQRHEVAAARLTLGVESLSASEIPEIMEMVQQDFRENPNTFDQSRYTLISALFGRWTMTDPSAALSFVHSCKQRSFKNMVAQQCFSSLAEADPARALAELAACRKGKCARMSRPG